MDNKDTYTRDEVIEMMRALYYFDESSLTLNEHRAIMRSANPRDITEQDKGLERQFLDRWISQQERYNSTVPQEIRDKVRIEER